MYISCVDFYKQNIRPICKSYVSTVSFILAPVMCTPKVIKRDVAYSFVAICSKALKTFN